MIGLNVIANARSNQGTPKTAPAATNESIIDNQVSHFIEGIRLQTEDRSQAGPSVPMGPTRAPVKSQVVLPGPSQGFKDNFNANIDQAKERANQMVIEVEKFKAAVNSPPGMSGDLSGLQLAPNFNHNHMSVNSGQFVGAVGLRLDSDNEFFRVTCHVANVLRERIQKGDYVELEKLLPKVKGWAGNNNKMNLIFKDGHSYFVPAAPESKISGVRRWEQAFRVYAAIYSEANPSRAAEIWQYVHIINVAASAYSWENVSTYDYTFRQLMAANLQRSWAKIYQQMWSISMRDPVTRFNSNGHNNGHNSNFQSNKHQGGNGQQKRVKYCWDFNKGRKCKDGDKCRYVDRCSVCDEASHGKNTCLKKV